MYCISKAAHGGVAHAGEHAHHSTRPAHDVYKFDAENNTERRGNDGRVECATCSTPDIVVHAWPTRSDGICERTSMPVVSIGTDAIPEP